eukprot:g3442.t1
MSSSDKYLENAMEAFVSVASCCQTKQADDALFADLEQAFKKQTEVFEATDFLTRDDAMTALGLSFRKVVDSVIESHESDDNRLDFVRSISNVFDLSIRCAEASMCSADTPFKLLECTFHAQTLDTCAAAWDILEKRSAVLANPLFVGEEGQNSLSKLSLLQLCNGLLQRCSQQLDTHFSGRILLFLSKACPLSERSGVNVTGSFNTKNKTVVDSNEDNDANFDSKEQISGGSSMDVVGEEAGEETTPILNYRLHRNFWKIQEYFASPNTALESFDKWKDFLAALETTLSTFEGLPLKNEAVKRTQNQCTKYLTQASLLRLQINDPALRRSVLLQILFALQYFSTDEGPIIERAIRESDDVAKIDRVGELEPFLARTLKLTESTGIDGSAFASSCKAILQRENFWTQWKDKKCRSYTRTADDDVRTGNDASQATDVRLQGAAKREKARFAKLERLYSPTDNLTCLSDGSNFHIPSLTEHLEDYRDAEDPENAIEEQYHPKKKPIYCWRGFRLLTKNHLHVFDAQEKIVGFDEAIMKFDGKDVTAAAHAKDIDAKKKDPAQEVAACEATKESAGAESTKDDAGDGEVEDTGDLPSKSDAKKRKRGSS